MNPFDEMQHDEMQQSALAQQRAGNYPPDPYQQFPPSYIQELERRGQEQRMQVQRHELIQQMEARRAMPNFFQGLQEEQGVVDEQQKRKDKIAAGLKAKKSDCLDKMFEKAY